MVAALIVATSLLFPPPVASFSAPAVVRVGQAVGYADTSYDPAPGHSIVLQIWTGRVPVFTQTGSHVVSLAVEDDRGLWGETSRVILVVASTPSPPSPPPESAGRLSASALGVFRGDSVSLTLTAPASAQNIRLELPAAFLQSVSLPTGAINYAQINAAAWVFRGGSWQTTMWVPWTQTAPPDGLYTLKAAYLLGGRSYSSSTVLAVDGTDRLGLWREVVQQPH